MLIPHSVITPIRAIDAASQSAAKSSAVASAEAASTNTNIAPATAEATARFQTMMNNVKLAPDRGVVARPQDSAVAKIVAQQDGVMGDIGADIERFRRNAPSLSPSEFAAESVQLQFKMAEMMTTIEMGVGFAQGGKSAVQNLMKNQ
jgi:type III secretion system HrpB2-like protein